MRCNDEILISFDDTSRTCGDDCASIAHLVFDADGHIVEWNLVDDRGYHGIREAKANGEVVLNDP